MSEMLALVHQEANGATMAAVSQGIDVPFQGVLLRLDATFEGLDTTYHQRGGAPGQHAPGDHRRQPGPGQLQHRPQRRSTEIAQGNTVNELQAGDSISGARCAATSSAPVTPRPAADQAGGHLSADQRRRRRLSGPAYHHGSRCRYTTTTPGTPTTTLPGATTGDPGDVADGDDCRWSVDIADYT